MKKIVSLLMAMVMMATACFAFTSCEDEDLEDASKQTYYIAAADFFYSEDAGSNYASHRKEYSTNETIYMKLIAKVTTNKETPETVKVKLTIPCITALDAKYYDGQPITPTYDAVQNVTTYEFTITAAMNAQEWPFVFQFKPNSAAEVKMVLEFDDKIDAMYDLQETVKFVEASVEE